MKRIVLAFGILVALFLVSVKHPTDLAAAVLASEATVADPGEGGGCLLCEDGPSFGCSEEQHHAWEPASSLPGDWARAGGPHGVGSACFDGTCDTKHGECTLAQAGEDSFGDEIEMIRKTIRAGDVVAVASLMKQYPERVLLNSSRAAIQVLSCNGDVAAHFPVSSVMVATLSSDARVRSSLPTRGTLDAEN